jgi:hypothetical protein
MRRKVMIVATGFAAALAAGWIAFPAVLYERSEQPLQFSHARHAGPELGMACEDCHSFAGDGRFAGVPAIATCAPCHQEPQGTTAAEKLLVDRYVSQGVEVPWLIYARQPVNVHFSHAAHVRLAGIACERCHGPHGATDTLRPFERNRLSGYSRDIWGRSMSRLRRAEWVGTKMGDCQGCHRERSVAESCLTCHK